MLTQLWLDLELSQYQFFTYLFNMTKTIIKISQYLFIKCITLFKLIINCGILKESSILYNIYIVLNISYTKYKRTVTPLGHTLLKTYQRSL